MLDFGGCGNWCVVVASRGPTLTTPEIGHNFEGCGVASVKIGSQGVGEVPRGFVIFVTSGGDRFSVVEELVYKIYVKYWKTDQFGGWARRPTPVPHHPFCSPCHAIPRQCLQCHSGTGMEFNCVGHPRGHMI